MINLSAAQYLIALSGSFLAGAINTLAGNGSIITLSILTDVMGIPANMANATNRVGIFLQSAGSVTGFSRHKQYTLQKSTSILLLTLAGSVLGVIMALWVSNEQFLFVFRYLMVVMLVIILVKPERWLHENEKSALPRTLSYPVFLILGFYGGFIQMGMGIFFLAVLVLLSGYSLMEANIVKTWVILIYTGLVLLLFALYGMVNWKIGLIMAIGQVAGGYITARYAPLVPNINTWAYYLLVVIVVIAVLLQFKIIEI